MFSVHILSSTTQLAFISYLPWRLTSILFPVPLCPYRLSPQQRLKTQKHFWKSPPDCISGTPANLIMFKRCDGPSADLSRLAVLCTSMCQSSHSAQREEKVQGRSIASNVHLRFHAGKTFLAVLGGIIFQPCTAIRLSTQTRGSRRVHFIHDAVNGH